MPVNFTSSPGICRDKAVLQPSLEVDEDILMNADRETLEDTVTEYYEWLSLIRLGSARVEPHDTVDPYLSRYEVPGDSPTEAQVCKLSWQGFMSASWLRNLLADIIVTCPSDQWFSLSATCISQTVSGCGNDMTILRSPGAAGKYLMWETRGSE